MSSDEEPKPPAFTHKKGDPPLHLRPWTPGEQAQYLMQLKVAEELHKIYRQHHEDKNG